MKLRRIAAVSMLAVMLAAQASWSAATTSGTYDETTYQGFGRYVYGLLDTSGMSGWGVAPLPVLLTTAVSALAGAPAYPRAIALARASAILLIDVPFVLIVYGTLMLAFGSGAAIAGTAFLVLSPNILAHASLATTDICFMAAALAVLMALAHHIERRSRGSLALLGFALAVALAAKYSALALFPVVAAASFLRNGDRSKSSARKGVDAIVLAGGLFVVALFFVWALHAFALAPYGLAPFEATLMPASIVGIARQLHHQSVGEPAFLLGQHSNAGWWYYMPVAFAMKSTPAEIVVGGAALAALVRGWRRASASGLVWRLAFLVFGASAILNRLALGVRYALVLIPLALFLALEQWQQWLGAGRHKPRALAAPAVLVVLQLFSAAAIAPHYLSYFNWFSGGPENGYLKLADSNVDWGQDLPALKEELAKLGAKHSLLSYFGTAPVDAYGVQADRWDGGVRDHFERWDWVAISATNLDGVFLPGDPFVDFRPLQPGARAGYSILLYPTSREDVRRAMATAAVRMP